jgi:hypothetical protein
LELSSPIPGKAEGFLAVFDPLKPTGRYCSDIAKAG